MGGSWHCFNFLGNKADMTCSSLLVVHIWANGIVNTGTPGMCTSYLCVWVYILICYTLSECTDLQQISTPSRVVWNCYELYSTVNMTPHTHTHTCMHTQCRAAPSVRGFIDQIFMEPTKIMVIGSDCSVSTSPIAELAPFWNLVHVSMGKSCSLCWGSLSLYIFTVFM